MFIPPRCPRQTCPMFEDPQGRWYVRNGYYLPLCRTQPVPRFICKRCGLGFSRQTFRADYYDKKPHVNPRLFELLSSGCGLRQSARLLHLTRRNLEMKFRKIAQHCVRLHYNLLDPIRGKCRVILFDELLTFEGRRNTRPVTVPIAIDHSTMFVLDARTAAAAPSGRMNRSRLAAIATEAKRAGPRRDRSSRAVAEVLATVAKLCAGLDRVVLRSDEKPTYASLARVAFGTQRLDHQQFSSRLRRDAKNPLFRINLTNAMARDNNGRLRRRSWLVSKRRRFLQMQLGIFAMYRNYVRVRFNSDVKQRAASPAMRIGYEHGFFSSEDCVGWRQVFGRLSIHPLEVRTARAIQEVRWTTLTGASSGCPHARGAASPGPI